jgi:UDP-N-acetylglucosamine 2-epimerase (non-hydrolysing)
MATETNKSVAVVFGTRPEAVKLAPVIFKLREREGITVRLCVTGQHRQMLDQILQAFQLAPDVDLNLMQIDQTLPGLTGRAVKAIGDYLSAEKPDMVLVQGDTATTLSGALAAYYNRIPIGHVEAGLRTGNKLSPFPEEMNRVLTTQLADYHFAPTESARTNLLESGVAADRIHVTGNTVIDALDIAIQKTREEAPPIPSLPVAVTNSGRHIVLITGHRRESFGEGFRAICGSIAELAVRFPDVAFVYPVHLNPNVQEPVNASLKGKPNVYLIPPLEYLPFVHLMDKSTLVLTDSGGIQEEAPHLAKPVLVMRSTTERPEGIDAGTAVLVGQDMRKIIDMTSTLLTDQAAYQSMANSSNPYGDGHAAERIAAVVRNAVKRA